MTFHFLAPARFLVVFLFIFFSGISYFNPEGNYQGQSMARNFSRIPIFSEEELERLDKNITQLLTDSGFNGTILITRFGMRVYEQSFGYANFSKRDAMNMETTFQLASISKTFTSAAILLLQQDSLLSVNDKVVRHIPEFPYDNITIKHLLTHTSGLQNYMWLAERRWTKRTIPNNEDILQLFIDNKRPLNFVSGQRFEYSNTGYVFLALIVERLSGMSYARYIDEKIFQPLEMTRSYVYDLHNPVDIENRAYGYRQARGRNVIIPDDKLDGPLGDKGIFSTTGDLLKWDQAIYRNAQLPEEVWAQAFENARLNNDSTVNYGWGWRLQDYIDKKIVHHPGRWHGFRTSLKRFTDDRTTLIMLSNNSRNIAGLIEKIQDMIYFEDKEIWLANNPDIMQEVEESEPEEIPAENL